MARWPSKWNSSRLPYMWGLMAYVPLRPMVLAHCLWSFAFCKAELVITNMHN